MTTTSAFSGLRQWLDSWPLIIVFGILYFTSQITIIVLAHPLGPDLLVVQTTLSADHVRAIFAKWQAAGLLSVYASHYRFDMMHPLWYSLFFATMLAKGFNANRVAARFNALLLLPFVAAGCDVIENLLHLSYLADRANITTGNVLISNGAAILKWTIAASCVVAVGLLAGRARFGTRARA